MSDLGDGSLSAYVDVKGIAAMPGHSADPWANRNACLGLRASAAIVGRSARALPFQCAKEASP